LDNLFQQIRSACKLVAGRATQVRIREDRLSAYAASLPVQRALHPEHDPERHYLGHGEDTAAFFVTLDAINFMSGYNPHLRKRPGMSGYFTIAAALNDHFRQYGPLSAQELARLDNERCASLFDQELANPAARELMELYAQALNELGRYLIEGYGGSFAALIETADCSAERLVRLLIRMPFFNDVETYGDLQVPLFKRAQLTAADLELAFNGRQWGHFADSQQLTIFADNLVPHVLHVDGVLEYDESLAARIGREELIPSGCPEEVEIRACGLHAVELLAAELGNQRQQVTARGLDYLLWNRGQEPYYKARPRHRTRSVYY
jgi:hypothetical protein